MSYGARRERSEALPSLAETPFLFVGFSLSDPNFNLVHDRSGWSTA
jgi:hypothetical protein